MLGAANDDYMMLSRIYWLSNCVMQLHGGVKVVMIERNR